MISWALRRYGAELSLVLVMVLLVWGSIAGQLAIEHSHNIRHARADAQTLSLALEENVRANIDTLDQSLRALRAAFLAQPNTLILSTWMTANISNRDLVLQMAIIDRNGFLEDSSLGRNKQTIDLSDREHFSVQRDSPGDFIYISRPLVGRNSSRWSIQVTRKILDAEGRFQGVVVASTDPYALSRFYDNIGAGQTSILLVGMDGVVRASAPSGDAAIGRDISGDGLVEMARDQRSGSYYGRLYAEDVDRFIGFHRLVDYPLVVAVGYDAKNVLGVWRQDRTRYCLGGLILTTLILVLGYAVLANKRHILKSRQTLRVTLENVRQGIVMIDAQKRATVVNRRASELLGLPEEPDAAARRIEAVLQRSPVPGGFESAGELTQMLTAAANNDSGHLATMHRSDGTIVEIVSRTLPDGGVVRTFTDVTDRKRAEDRIVFLAHHDPLTELANRAAWEETLQTMLAGSSPRIGHAVLCMDVDRFKLINDTHGHHIGDRLLAGIAKRLRGEIRKSDLAARLGGDEFVILQQGADGNEAMALAHRLIAAISHPFELERRVVETALSIGISLFPSDGTSPDELMRRADHALYHAKRSGGSVARLFEASMDLDYAAELQREAALREAVRMQRLHLEYQPIVETRTLQVRGYEALLRWTDPVLGPIPPSAFIPIAERCGLLVAIGAWVLETACRDAAQWDPSLSISVNVSPAQFREALFAQRVADIVAASGLAHHRLTLEITEGMLITETSDAWDTIAAIRAIGLKVALDDFGSGNASLAYLRRSVVDSVKIDRSFIDGLGRDAKSLAIVQAMLLLARRLGLAVVGEGVETELQLDVLRRLGCDMVQGYLTGRPRRFDGSWPKEEPAFTDLTRRPIVKLVGT